jgi:hypothetical protein
MMKTSHENENPPIRRGGSEEVDFAPYPHGGGNTQQQAAPLLERQNTKLE